MIFHKTEQNGRMYLFSVPVPYQRSAAFTPLQRWTSSERVRIHEPRASADVEAASRPRCFGKALNTYGRMPFCPAPRRCQQSLSRVLVQAGRLRALRKFLKNLGAMTILAWTQAPFSPRAAKATREFEQCLDMVEFVQRNTIASRRDPSLTPPSRRRAEAALWRAAKAERGTAARFHGGPWFFAGRAASP